MKQQGYTLAGALIMVAILSIFMALSVPIWSHIKQRENEEELIFRGKEYVEAIARYHARFHSFPPDLETLYKQKFIRKLYKDPMTESGKWKVLRPDSLLQTGAAGQINQPGQQQESDEEKNENGSSSISFGSTDEKKKEQKETAESGTEEESEKEEGLEEPESETVGPVAGVVSRSKKTSIKIYNDQSKYNKWAFVFAPQETAPQPPGEPGKPKPGSKDQPKKQPKTQPPQQPPSQKDNP